MRVWLVASILCASTGASLAAEVALVGVFPGKALLVIDGGAPRAVAVGESHGGVRVLAVDKEAATVEFGGRQSRLTMGTPVSVGAREGSAGGQEVTLIADARGHFLSTGRINGASTRFLVDTGASMVSMGPAAAQAAGVDYRKGEPGWMNTANGTVQVWRVRLDKVTLGDITLTNVEGIVGQTEMPYALLGMSFLNRMEMRRDGSTMTLKRRY